MKVCKFGGTSVGSVERMKNVANLISDDHPKIVVLSATAGTTDHLEKIVSYIFNREIDEAHNEITKLEFYFVDFANKLLKDDCIKRQAIDYILDRFRLLWNFTRNSFTVADEKEIVAQGELISTALMSFYLKEQKKSNVLLSAFDFMRIGPDGEPDMEYIEKHLSELIKKYKGIPLFITQGFICKNAYNETDNLKRGGSDYTASLIGAAINAEEIQIWTDIDGMHNNDPRIVKNTTPIKKLRIEDALAATKAAVEEGIVAGGGTALINAIPAVEELIPSLEGDEKTGAQIILRAQEEPVRQIAHNAGLEGSVIIDTIKRSGKTGYGFDAYNETYVDMIPAGIVDPTKVTRSALQNAASVAAMVLTTESLVADIPAPEPAPAMPQGGMGMGY